MLIAAPFLLPEYRDTGAGRLDLVSVGLSLAAILPVIYGLKKIAADGLDAKNVLAIVAGLAVGVVFDRRQRRLADPLLDLRLFENRSFSAAFGILLIAESPIFVLGTALVVGSAPPEKAGSASSLSQTSSDLGVALGIAAMGSIGTAVYHTQLADTAPDLPPDLPAERVDLPEQLRLPDLGP